MLQYGVWLTKPANNFASFAVDQIHHVDLMALFVQTFGIVRSLIDADRVNPEAATAEEWIIANSIQKLP